MIGIDKKVYNEVIKIDQVINDVGGVQGDLTKLENNFDESCHYITRWFGLNAVEASLTPYVFTSGGGAFGAAVQILQPADTPFIAGKLFFKLPRALVTNINAFEPIILRVLWGAGTENQAELAGQYSDFGLLRLSTLTIAGGVPLELNSPKLAVNTFNVWGKIKSATITTTVSLLFGTQEFSI